jgi:hypothetical protein
MENEWKQWYRENIQSGAFKERFKNIGRYNKEIIKELINRLEEVYNIIKDSWAYCLYIYYDRVIAYLQSNTEFLNGKGIIENLWRLDDEYVAKFERTRNGITELIKEMREEKFLNDF